MNNLDDIVHEENQLKDSIEENQVVSVLLSQKIDKVRYQITTSLMSTT